PPATVRGRLERGRAKLHARLARRGLSLPAALGAVLALPRGAPSAALADATVRLLSADSVPPAVAALTGSAGFALKWHAAGAALLIAGVIGISAAALPGGGREGPAPAKEQAARPDRPERVAEETDEDEQTLCPAVRRFGTLRMRACATPIAFAPDG